jgi:uncharacterized protein YbbC (DUF1343 family)
MVLDGGRAGAVRVLTPASVAAMTAAAPPPAGPERGLGWERNGSDPTAWSASFSPRSFGHTGYTGTALWIDPAANAYVVMLTNRVHPNDGGVVRPLRTRLTTLVAASAPGAAVAGARGNAAADVRTGVDVLAERGFAPLVGRRVGLITNHSGRDHAGRRTIDVLRAAPGVTLAAIFSPEHGLTGDVDRRVPSGWDADLGIPVYSLYGATQRPTPEMLAGLDALVFDVQDAGVRFYTYVTTMAYAMEAAAARGLPFYVLDRPNPIGADAVQGPVLEDDLRSFAGYFRLPVRYGMTIGELATLLNAENAIGADLHVIPMRGYARTQWYDQTGLPWVAPSPNLRSLPQAALYPGVALLEGANVSVGRGTDTPFEVVGAPWIDGVALAARLNARALPGVRFAATTFVPSQAPYHGRRCGGVRIALVDRVELDAPAVGIEIASALERLYPKTFGLDATVGMIGARWVVAALKRGDDPRQIAERWQPELQAFAAVRRRFLLY